MKALPRLPRDYWIAWASTLLFFCAFYTLLVPLPLYLVGAGLPDWQVGLILGAFGVASLIIRPVSGELSDRYGCRSIMLSGASAFLVGTAGTTATIQPSLLFLLRTLQAAGYVAFTTAGTALASELAPQDKRGSALAMFGAAANVAMTLTPAVVSTFLDRLTIKGAFWLSGALAVTRHTILTCTPESVQKGRKAGLAQVGGTAS